jgi:hypothetical protein
MKKITNNLLEKVIGLCLMVLLQTGCDPAGNHLLHCAFPPDDLYVPIATNSISLHVKGATTEFRFTPKYKDTYEVGLFAVGDPIPATYKFSGKIYIEFILSGERISSQTVTNFSSGTYVGKDMNHYSSRGLCSFDVPLQGQSMDEITIKVSVLKADQEFEKFKDKIKGWIRVSPVP